MRRLRLTGLGAVAVLLVLVFGGWGPRHPTGPAAPEPARRPAPAPALDAEAVVEEANHGIAAGPTGALEVGDEAYRARFDRAGFAYAPTGRGAELTVSLAGLVRGDEAVVADGRPWTARGNVAERPVAPGAVERVTARDGEVEWDVVLAREPAGAGPLVVTGHLDGVSATTATGIRLDDGSTVDLGDLVVKDATGATVHRARPGLHGSEIRLEVPARVLEGAAYPLTLDPTVSTPTPVSSTGDRTNPSVAWSGSVFLVVWEQTTEGDSNIYGAAVDGNGQIVHGARPLAVSLEPEHTPDVAYSNSGVFTLVYQSVDFFDPAITSIVVADVGADGTILRRNRVDQGRGKLELPTVASTGTRELVTWRDDRSGSYDVRARRVFTAIPEGETFTVWGERPGLPVVEDQVDPDVAWNGSVFMVAWRDGLTSSLRDVYVTRVSSTGTVLSTTPVSTGGHQELSPEIASDGTNFLVLWADNRSGNNDVYGARVDGSGTLLGAPFPVVQRAGTQVPMGVAFNGTYLVAWRDNRNGNSDIFAGRVDGTGRVLDGTGFAVATASVEENFAAVSRGSGSTWGVVDKSGIRSSAVIEWRRVSPK